MQKDIYTRKARMLPAVACFGVAAVMASDLKMEPVAVAVQRGTTTFIANTNVTAISVKGKSTALEARVNLRRSAEAMQLERIEARLPVKTLVTGMGLRDDHMRKYVFTTADGQVPDLLFEGDNAACTGSAKTAVCQVAGMLTIRGVARPFSLPLKVREEGAGFRASGEAVVKLSAYGIEPPSQFGVKTADDVQLQFDFTAKTGGGGGAGQ